MPKVREMFNKSDMVIPVEMNGGSTVYVRPRTRLENVDVANLEKVRRFFIVKEDLTEVTPPQPRKADLTEVGRAEEKPKTEGKERPKGKRGRING